MGLRTDVVDRRAEATQSMALVRVDRSPRNADRVDGFVLALGRKWVLVAQVRDGGFFDGLVAIRLKDVLGVTNESTFEARFARTRPEWPPKVPAVIDLDSTHGVIRDLSRVSPLIRVEQDRHHDSDMTWIGTVEEISKGWLWLHEVRPDATWRKRPLGYRLKRITKVAISDVYLTALAAVAGSHPETGGRAS